MRRIDYIFCNKTFLDKIIQSKIADIPMADHRAVIAEAPYNLAVKRNGFWKLNNSVLNDPEYIRMINDVIERVKTQYQNSCPQILWDCCTNIVQDVSINYCKKITKAKKTQIIQIEKQLAEHNNPDLINATNRLKMNLNKASVDELKGAHIRSRIKWVEEGERNTNFFLTLENIRAKQKSMTELHTDNGIIRDQKGIMNEQLRFYKNVYKKTNDFGNIIPLKNASHSP